MSYSASSHHSFDVNLAMQLKSVDLAIVVHHFQYWINKNKQLGRNFIDGRTWTYQTREEIAACFPYFSSDQVRRMTDRLVKLGILKKGNFNKHAMDKTIWYSFENEEIFTIGKSAKSIGKSASSIGESAEAIPQSIPKSIPSYNKDLGTQTSAIDKNQSKTSEKKVSPAKRWKLNEDQEETFLWLKEQDIDAEDKKLCYWAKTHALQRLIEVYHEAKSYKPNSMRAYMSKLLDDNKAVPKAHAEMNRQFALEYLKSNPNPKAKIYKKYIKTPFEGDFFEIDFNMEPVDFAYRLMEKLEKIEGKS